MLQVVGSSWSRRVLFEDETRAVAGVTILWIGGSRRKKKSVTLRLEVAQVPVHQHVVVEAAHGGVSLGLVIPRGITVVPRQCCSSVPSQCCSEGLVPETSEDVDEDPRPESGGELHRAGFRIRFAEVSL